MYHIALPAIVGVIILALYAAVSNVLQGTRTGRMIGIADDRPKKDPPP